LLLLAALFVCFTLVVLALRVGAAVPPGSVWFPLCLLGIAIAFFCGSWSHGGQTVGMRAWKVRVVRADGAPLDWPLAIARFAAAVVGLLPAGLGFWWCWLDAEKRGWHDLWTRTRVVHASVGRRSAHAQEGDGGYDEQ
jgi:uncharacterized RDD family membrane protein YckC